MLKKIIFKGYRRVQNISTPNKLSSRFMKQKTARVIRRNRNSLDVVSLNIPLLISFHSLWTLECVCVLVAQLCPTLSDPVDCSLPGSSIHGIFQARVLEWVAISFSRTLEQCLANCGPHAKSCLLIVLAKKHLLEHSNIHLFMYSSYKADLNSYNRD